MPTDTEKLEVLLAALTSARAGAHNETSEVPVGTAFVVLQGGYAEQEAKMVEAADQIAQGAFVRSFLRAAAHASNACQGNHNPAEPCAAEWVASALTSIAEGD